MCRRSVEFRVIRFRSFVVGSPRHARTFHAFVPHSTSGALARFIIVVEVILVPAAAPGTALIPHRCRLEEHAGDDVANIHDHAVERRQQP
jgi:hypothetical protein